MAAAESHRASLSFPSDNGKTGSIAVSSTSRHTCPASSPLAGDQGCYAEVGFHTRLNWHRLSRGESGLQAAAFLLQVLALPAGILFRHCVASDQLPDPADRLRIDKARTGNKSLGSLGAYLHAGRFAVLASAGLTCKGNRID